MNEYDNIVKDIINNKKVLEMKKYKQHFNTNCYEHSLDVSYISYKVGKKLHLDYKSLARAGMLHDLFLYDWHVKNGRKGFHAFTHGKCALNNASQLFDLNKKEKDMIKKHMWPVTPIPPFSIEGFILTLVDKYCASKEIVKHVIKHK